MLISGSSTTVEVILLHSPSTDPLEPLGVSLSFCSLHFTQQVFNNITLDSVAPYHPSLPIPPQWSFLSSSCPAALSLTTVLPELKITSKK